MRIWKPVFNILIFILILIQPSCGNSTPVLIGLSVELTGPHSSLGIDARDAAQLAVDTINAEGGVAGRPIELVVRDEAGDPDRALSVDLELIDLGVVAIIGHITSQQTAAVFQEINQIDILLISPTSSSPQFNDQDDNFFRLMPSNIYDGIALARYIFHETPVRQIVGVYDIRNRAFAESMWNAIQSEFTALGGDARLDFTFTSGEDDLLELMKEVKLAEPEGIVFIATGVDTALMVQYGHQLEIPTQYFSSTWAQTSELIHKGGNAIEGLVLVAVYNPNNKDGAFLDFSQAFEERYQRPPGLSAPYSYESVLVLAKALEHTGGEKQGLRQEIKNIKGMEGVIGPITFNQHGDVLRDVYIVIVNDSRFETISTISFEE
jgi:branched-chain amino acid transport system substrate-binding protein